MKTANEQTAFEVKVGQTYLPCRHWNWQPSRPFVIESILPTKVRVWDPFGGPNGLGTHRWVGRGSLHETGYTKAGAERQTGYRLHSQPPTSKWQELCGSCMTWCDREQLAIRAWGYGHSTCIHCKSEMDKEFQNP